MGENASKNKKMMVYKKKLIDHHTWLPLSGSNPRGKNENARFTCDEIVRVAHGERKFAFQRIIISQREISTHEVRFHHSESDFTRVSEFH